MKINTSEQIQWFISNLSKKYMELPANVFIKIDLDETNYNEILQEITRAEYPKELINENHIIGEYCGVKVYITKNK